MDWNTGDPQYTMSNVTHSDGLYYAAFIRTLVYVGIATGSCRSSDTRSRISSPGKPAGTKGLFLALFFAPFWISYMLRMTAWIGLLQDDGYVNRVLQESVGISTSPSVARGQVV